MKQQFLMFFSIILISSCVSNIDTEQLNNIEISPIVKLSLIHFKANTSLFNATTNFQSDITEFNFFNNNLAQGDNIVKVDLKFDISNSFNNDFVITYQFLNKDLNLLKEIQIDVSKNNELNKIVTFEGEELAELIKTRAIIAIVNMVDSNPINSPMELDFKSAADVFLKIGVDE